MNMRSMKKTSGEKTSGEKTSGNSPGPVPLWPAFALLTGLAVMGLVMMGPVFAAGKKQPPAPDLFVPSPQALKVETWVSGLEAPWSLVFLPEGGALVSERPGRIRRILSNGALAEGVYASFDSRSTRKNGFPALRARGEGGLMGLALHPRFAESPFVYVMYTARTSDGTSNIIIRFKHQGEQGGERGVFDKIILSGPPGARYHNGGRIAFGPDGMLYVTTGEIFERDLAQDRASLGGKILRLTPEGAVPDDNPWPGSPVYSLGHRNPQGLAWHPRTGALYASEHGPSGEVGFGAHDEVNLIRPGRNYGWPRAIGAVGKAGFEDPIAVWPEYTTPPSGMAFWDGALFVATLRSEALLRLALSAEGDRVISVERWFSEYSSKGRFGRLRDAVAGPDGRLYVLTSNRGGRGDPRPGDDRILRISR